MSNESTDQTAIDPDPYAFMTAVLGTAATAYQFVQIHLQLDIGQTAPQQDGQRDVRLSKLEDALEDIQRRIDKILRAIDRGSHYPEKEFYDAKFSFGVGLMKLERGRHSEYIESLLWLTNKFGEFANWAGNVIANDPSLAAQLGCKILELASGAPDKINELIAQGKSNRQILAEARLILSSCQKAVQSCQKQQN